MAKKQVNYLTTGAFLWLSFASQLTFAYQSNHSVELSNSQIKQVVNNALETFDTPGMAIAIIHQGEIRHIAGYGVRNIASQEPVDQDTLFRLASTSKAFTAASLAILVDEGRLTWHDKVIDHLPEFRMKAHWVTAEFTISDLLTHQSGLVDSAGDSMLWPEPSGFTHKEIIHNLRYLTPEYSFRSTYAYSNVMYIVAGEIVARISGMPYESFVAQRIFKPLNMQCYAGDMPEKALKNIATPYGARDGAAYEIPRNGIHGTATVYAAAGGIVCNARSMAQWLKMLLNNGNMLDSQPIISEQQLSAMWYSRTILPMSDKEKARDRSHFKTYGYGWRKNDFLGYELISHTGTLSGMQAYVAMIPELELGVVLLNNGSNSYARLAVMQTLLRSYISQEGEVSKDWVEEYRLESIEEKKKQQENRQVPQGSGRVLLSENAYVGQYQDPWFGVVKITRTVQGLRLNFPKMITLSGTLEPFDEHSFVVRWDNQNAADDAFVHFKTRVSGEVHSLTMSPFSLTERTSHEYRDMFFIRQNDLASEPELVHLNQQK